MLEGNPWLPPIFELVVIVMVAIVGSLISSLVGIVIIIFLKVAFLIAVPIMRLIIAAVSHTRFIILVFRIIFIVVFLRSWGRHKPRCASSRPESQCHCRYPNALLQIYT